MRPGSSEGARCSPSPPTSSPRRTRRRSASARRASRSSGGGEQPERLAWCEVEKIVSEGASIAVYGNGIRIGAGLPQHGPAAAWILAEALDRIPKRVDVPAEQRDKLPRTDAHPGSLVDAEPLQVAGRRCKSSGKLISFEDDARLCPRCAEVYHRDHEEERCLTCEGSMREGESA